MGYWNRMITFADTHTDWGPSIVRVSIAAVFLWFGIDKFVHPVIWAGWVPAWMTTLIPMSLTSFMYLQGIIEALVGALLLLGLYTRLAALLAAITIIGVEIALITTGAADVMLRDAGLLAASLSLFFTGSDCLSIDGMLAKKKTSEKKRTLRIPSQIHKRV